MSLRIVSRRNKRSRRVTPFGLLGLEVRAESLEQRVLLSAVSWTGGAGDGQWSTAANWSSGAVPTSTDDVTINVGGNPTIQVNSGQSVQSLNCADTLAVNSSLSITNGMVLNGTILLGKADSTTSGQVYFGQYSTAAGSLTGSGTVVFGGSSGNEIFDNSAQGGAVATLTIGPGITIHGKNGRFVDNYSAGTLLNQGTIDADTAGGTITISDASFTNAGTTEATAGGILTIQTSSWSSSGTVAVNAATLNLGGTFTQAGLGNFSRSGGTVNLTGMLSGNLALTAATGSWVLSGGTVQNGTYTASGGALLAIQSGTFDTVTANSDLDLSQNSGSLTVVNGLVLNANLLLGKADSTTSGQVYFGQYSTAAGSLTGSGTVVFGGSSGNEIFDNSAQGGAVATLTIGPGITIHGKNGRFVDNYSAGTLLNQGTIDADTAGGTITISDASFTNAGTTEATAGGILTIQTSSWSSSGTVAVNAATLNLGGTFTQAGLGNFSRSGGTVNLTGMLSGNLALTAATGSWVLSGGTVQNGTYTASGGALLAIQSGTFDTVTANSDLDLSQNSGSLTVVNGLVLNANLLLGKADSTTSGQVYFGQYSTAAGSLTGSGTVVFGGSSGNEIFDNSAQGGAVATLTIGPGITIHGKNGRFVDNYSAGTLLNQGTIDADTAGGTITISDASFTNAGTTEATAGGILTIQTSSWSSSGTVAVNAATLNLGGTFTQAGLGNFSRSGGTVNLTGMLSGNLALTAATGSWVLSGGTVQNGTYTASGGALLAIQSGTFDTVTANSDLDLSQNSGSLTVVNGLVLNANLLLGKADSTTSGQVYFGQYSTAAGSLTGSGTVVFGGSSGNEIFDNSAQGGAVATLTIGPGITIHGKNGRFVDNYSAGTLLNQGTIDADTAGGTITISDASFTNAGSLSSIPSATIDVTSSLLATSTNVQQNNPAGTLYLAGSGTAASPQLLEAISQDAGAHIANNVTNSVYGTLSTTGYVKLVDQSHNAPGNGAEAVYCITLNVPTGSTLDLNGLHLYAGVQHVSGTIVNGSVTALPANELPIHLAFVHQPTAATSGATISPAVTIAIQDANGNTITTDNSNVMISLGTLSGTGSLGGTLTVAAQNGVATFSNLSVSAAGSYTLSASDASDSPATSNTFAINPLSTTLHLAFVQGPSDASAGNAISPAIKVAVEDANNNAVTSDNSTVTVALAGNASGGMLSGTAAIPAVNGVATFSNLSVQPDGTYALVASDGSDTPVTSAIFTIGVIAPPATGLLPEVARTTLPGTIIGGSFSGGAATVTLTNEDDTLSRGRATVVIFASTTGAVDESAMVIGSASVGVNIPASKSMPVVVPLKAAEVAALPLGSYTLLAEVTDPSDNTNDAVTGPVLSVTPLVSITAPPTVDTSFGAGGAATLPFSAQAQAVQSDGSLVVVGYQGNPALSTAQAEIQRLTPDGVPDPAFGGGSPIVAPAGNNDAFYGVTIQGDGKIVAAGQAGGSLLLERFNADGSIDSSFGTAGRVTANLGSNSVAFAVTLATGNALIAVGSAGGQFAAARFTPAGALDTSFGSGGSLVFSAGLTNDVLGNVAMQTDGKILAAGSGGSSVVALRINTNGALDSTFGAGGVATVAGLVPYTSGAADHTIGLALQGDGRILVANHSAGLQFATARLTSTGAADSTFGSGGVVTTAFNNTDDADSISVVPATGDVVVVGTTFTGSVVQVAVADYTSAGVLNSSGTGGGQITLDAGVVLSRAYSLGNLFAAAFASLSRGRLVVGKNGSGTGAGTSSVQALPLFGATKLLGTFGVAHGHRVTLPAIQQPDGASVTLTLTGGTGTAYIDRDNIDLQLTGNCVLTVRSVGTARLGTINVAGALTLLNAGSTNLVGTMHVTQSIGRVVLGNISGSLISDASIASLTAGSISGNVSANATLGIVRAGSITGVIAAGQRLNTLIAASLTNAKVLSGATASGSGAIGNPSGGSILSLRVTGAIVSSFVGAGVNPVDNTFGNGNDASIGGTTSALRSFSAGSVDDVSVIEAGNFGSVRVASKLIKRGSDSRFRMLS